MKKCHCCGRPIGLYENYWMDAEGYKCIVCADARGLLKERSVNNGSNGYLGYG